MNDLPEERLQPGYQFLNIGVDYAGPILIKNKRGRGARTSKCYICLFVCSATKAMHIEAVTELTMNILSYF